MEDVYKNQNMARGKKWWALRKKSVESNNEKTHTHTRAQVTGKSSHQQIIKETLSDKYTHTHTQRDIPIYAREEKKTPKQWKKTQPISVNI